MEFQTCPNIKKEKFYEPFPDEIFTISVVNDDSTETNIYLGTPPQPVRVFFDSGAVHSWFAHPSAKGFSSDRPDFDDSKSETFFKEQQ